MTAEAARTVAEAFLSCRLDYCNSLLYDLPGTLLRNATARLITDMRHGDYSRPYNGNFTGYPSESVSSAKMHVWFASRCPGRRLSTWQTIAASCLTALGALCGQLTFQPAWCSHENSAVTTTELSQSLDLACGTSFRSMLRNLDITDGLFRRQLKGHLFSES